MWPTKQTAFLVIHGSGYHPPFAALDNFVRGFREYLRKHSNQDLDDCWRHELLWHDQRGERPSWAENYISLKRNGEPTIDFYEYYWDCYMDHEISFTDAIKWLGKASDGAKRFYSDPKNRERWERDDDAKAARFLSWLGPFGWALTVLKYLGLMKIPYASQIAAALLALISGPLRRVMQDIAIYCTTDTRAKNYRVRQEVVRGAVEQLKMLLEMDYNIVVVGHSLGSVIAYDALNRIIMDTTTNGNREGGIDREYAQRIIGLVTFGSVLDKVAFFFREHTADEQYVRRQILNHFHIFGRIVRCPFCPQSCAKEFPNESELTVHINQEHSTYCCSQCDALVKQGDVICPGCKAILKDPIRIYNTIENFLDTTKWLNVHHPKDLYGGRLDAYKGVHNHVCDKQLSHWKTALGKRRSLKQSLVSVLTSKNSEAHGHYWDCDFMYEKIAEVFFK